MNSKMKGILIAILLLVIILLAFVVLLYDYIPLNKIVPTTVKYEASEEVKAQLKEIAVEDNSNVVLTYEVSDSDLGVYENTKSYDKGKANPFSSYGNGQTTSSSGITSNNASSSNGNASAGNTETQSQTNTQTTTSSSQNASQTTDTFYEDTNTK